MQLRRFGNRCYGNGCVMLGAAALLIAGPARAETLGAAANASRPSPITVNNASAGGLKIVPARQLVLNTAIMTGRTAVETPPHVNHVISLGGEGIASGIMNAADKSGTVSVEQLSGNGHMSFSRAIVAGEYVEFRALPTFARSGRLPIAGARLTSGMGMRIHPVLGGYRAHQGIDLAAPVGTPVVATSDGFVSRAGWFGSYGLFVSLEHNGGTQSRYGHMSQLNVAPGQNVKAGEIIGYVGSTGRSTGPHLHYELRIGGQPVNPLPERKASR